jgi:hypothetical protein
MVLQAGVVTYFMCNWETLSQCFSFPCARLTAEGLAADNADFTDLKKLCRLVRLCVLIRVHPRKSAANLLTR